MSKQQLKDEYRFLFSLNTIEDMKKYNHMLEMIPFSGEVRGKNFQCPAEDILFIFSQCFLKKLVMNIPKDQKTEAEKIEMYLEKEGLLLSKEIR